jgi:hypothetical protein
MEDRKISVRHPRLRGAEGEIPRWLGTVLLHGENRFRSVKGHLDIARVIATIEQMQEEKRVLPKAASEDLKMYVPGGPNKF